MPDDGQRGFAENKVWKSDRVTQSVDYCRTDNY
jgi:hypothetical protein